MASSLASVVASPLFTKAAILQAVKSDAGMRTAWIIVEAEEDYNVYNGFMNPATTVVKTSEGDDGRRGYANGELIVTDVKAAVPAAHICGIRDADYTKYEDKTHVFPANIFPTDRRDLEMMMLDSSNVLNALRSWTDQFAPALVKASPVCRHLGYLRIFNHVKGLLCVFRDQFRVGRFWDFGAQNWITDWKVQINTRFFLLSRGRCNEALLNTFVTEKSLDTEDIYDIIRGHDLLSALSLALINTIEYSPENIMRKMKDSYTIGDFKSTRLYACIKSWQETEGVSALVA